MSRTVGNNGVGALYGSFTIHKTGATYDFAEADIGSAVGLSGNNEIDPGTDGGVPLGRLEYVGDGVATVQVAGVVRLAYTSPAPALGNAVVLDGAGGVKQAPAVSVDLDGSGSVTLEAAGGDAGRGTVIAVDSGNSTVDVLLG